MHAHVYNVEEQFGAEIWAKAKTEKYIKNASSPVAPSRSRGISYSTALEVVGLRWKKIGQQKADKAFKGVILIRFRFRVPGTYLSRLCALLCADRKTKKTAPFSFNFIRIEISIMVSTEIETVVTRICPW